MSESPPPNYTPITNRTVINHRFEIRRSLGKGGMGEVFLAYDGATHQEVALKIVREEARMPGDDEALRQELLHARAVSHPNVCRVHDLAPSVYGSILVMEYIAGQTLHTHIRKKKTQGGYTPDEFRRIAGEVCSGVAAIHAQGLVHGDMKPANVMVTTAPDGTYGKAVVLDFGFAKERARVLSHRPSSPPDGGTPNYMSPERMRSGGASQEDDVYALAMTLWEMWTCKVPDPGSNPRAKPMREQIMFDVPSGLSVDEVKQIFSCLSENPASRLPARHMRFFNPIALTSGSIVAAKERLDPGPPPGKGANISFSGSSQALLVTYASNAPELVGTLYELNKPKMTFGRRPDVDIPVSEATVSGIHARIRWGNGNWHVEDLKSTNGTYVEHVYERKSELNWIHGSEVQFGELRAKLVNFQRHSAHHKKAVAFLKKRDGLTGLLSTASALTALEDEAKFSAWADVPLHFACYEVKPLENQISDRPTIIEMIALKRAASRVVELTDVLLVSIIAVTAARTGTLRFVVSMMGQNMRDTSNLVDLVVSQVQNMMPEGLRLVSEVIPYRVGFPLRSLMK